MKAPQDQQVKEPIAVVVQDSHLSAIPILDFDSAPVGSQGKSPAVVLEYLRRSVFRSLGVVRNEKVQVPVVIQVGKDGAGAPTGDRHCGLSRVLEHAILVGQEPVRVVLA
jgi:hypothetical protein